MLRSAVHSMVAIVVCGFATYVFGQSPGQLIPDQLAAQHGLVRCWRTQAQFDRATSRATYAVLHQGTLFVQSDRGMVQAIDAQTGRTLWVQQIGNPKHPTLPLGVNNELVAVVNGSRLYVLNRFNGEVLLEVRAGGVPAAGPALSEVRAYVPMVDGLIVAHRLEAIPDVARESIKAKPEAETTQVAKPQAKQEHRHILRLRQEGLRVLRSYASGRPYAAPVVLRQTPYDEYVSWVTDTGSLYIAQVDRRAEDALTVLFRIRFSGNLPPQPVYLPPKTPGVTAYGTVLLVTSDGFVLAIDERSGNMLWRFSTGSDCEQSPALVDGRLYVATMKEGMYCLDARTGRQVWWTPEAVQFLAESRKYVYAVDNLDRLLIIDAESGGRIARMPLGRQAIKVTNTQTDRIYLVSDFGLVQALRETELVEPLVHNQVSKPADEPQAEEQQPAGEKPPAKEGEKAADPFAPAPDSGAAAAPPTRPSPANSDGVEAIGQSANNSQAAGRFDNPFGS